VNCGFYRDNNSDDIFMTSKQVGKFLEYANPRTAVNIVISRNPYLRNEEFSGDINLMSPG
jgi:hypothetical protein